MAQGVSANHRLNIRGYPLRPVQVFTDEVKVERYDNGTIIMRSAETLAAFDDRIGDWVDRWAVDAPGRNFLVEQQLDGERAITVTRAIIPRHP